MVKWLVVKCWSGKVSESSKQMAFRLGARLAYRPDNFVLHSGVQEVVRISLEKLGTPGFFSLFVRGDKRSGKTHLSVFLSGILAKNQVYPALVEGAHFSAVMNEFVDGAEFAGSPVIVDDAELYFKQVVPGISGQFVSFMEKMKVAGRSVLFISGSDLKEFPCDEHVLSRLKAASIHQMVAPAAEEMELLLRNMAEQRGIRLTERKRQFLMKRLARSPNEIESYFERLEELLVSGARAVGFEVLEDAL